uniref:Rieske domain-containing protein n=1 Tax=Coccolithus braarudii TaxID=221442 RepID=A0A7S0LNZ6_9EUKA|mmetsp:Transcript_48857/g.104298  ORF Transcript_48857/g.104298 Transcript_48857/m.104298 type:complete len:232 (+) Transcript_48857:95-790(+)
MIGFNLARLLGFVTLVCVSAWQPVPAALRSAAHTCSRTAVVDMKGRGSRGMPGKATGYRERDNEGMKKRMQKRDFDKKEWVQVVSSIDEEMGTEPGATKAVTAGITPRGQDFIWCLIRGNPAVPEGGDQVEEKVFAVDGSCRCCQFPMSAGKLGSEPDGSYSFECGLCGTKYSLDNGEVLEFLPKKNPAQWAAALPNESKGPQKTVVLPARVSKAGKVYLRLPDGTLLNPL